jgi:pimeloyl-ACP methyl ester carboxylesterase
MRIQKLFILAASVGYLFSSAAHADDRPLPEQPTSAEHPGSAVYPYSEVKKTSVTFQGRRGTLYLPKGVPASKKIPLVAFGHGFKVPEFTYGSTFRHLARKGIAVYYVPYDTGASDRNFLRMAKDFSEAVRAVIEEYPKVIDQTAVVYSGHSNGATVALLAAQRAPAVISEAAFKGARSVLGFATNGALFKRLEVPGPSIPVSLVVGEDDRDDPPAESKELFEKCTGYRQMIVLRSYKEGFDEEVLADHGSIRTLGWSGDQTSPLHYFGYWKFLIGAAEDAMAGGEHTNKWLYGKEAADTGDAQLRNEVIR